MPNARQTSLIASPSSSRATNRRRSSITEHSFHGIHTSPKRGKGVTHVSGTICHLCLGPLIQQLGLEEYQPAFRANAIDGSVLLTLTAEDLKDLGVELVGHRRKMLNAIAALSAGPTPSQPEPLVMPAGAERRH